MIIGTVFHYIRRMNLAGWRDKKVSVSIIADTFDANPSVNIVIGDTGNRRKKIKL